MLVVQQGGIDLSVAGGISLALVIVTHIPDGDNARLLPAIALGAPVRDRSRAAQRRTDRRARAQPDHRHPRHQCAALRHQPRDLRRTTEDHHPAAGQHRGWVHRGCPELRLLRASRPGSGLRHRQADRGRPPLRGDRGEPSGRPSGRPTGPDLPVALLRLGPAALLPGRDPDRRHHLAARGLRRRPLPAALDRGRGARRHLTAGWAWLPPGDRDRRGLPAAADPAGQRARRLAGDLAAGPGGRARGRHLALHRQLARGLRPSSARHPPSQSQTGIHSSAPGPAERDRSSRANRRRENETSHQIAAIFIVATVSLVLAGCGSSGGQANGPGARSPTSRAHPRGAAPRRSTSRCSTVTAATAGAWSPPPPARTRPPSARASRSSATPTARATRRRRSPTSRAWCPPVSTRWWSSPTPARRCSPP